MRRQIGGLALTSLLGIAGIGMALQNQVAQIGEQADGSVLVSSHQRLTPLGTLQRLEGARPKALALHPDGSAVAVLAQGRVALYDLMGKTLSSVGGLGVGPLGLAWTPDGKTLFASLEKGKVARLRYDSGQLTKESELTIDSVGPAGEPDVAAGTQGRGRQTGDPQITGLAVSGDGAQLFVGMGIRNAVAVVELATGKTVRVLPVGVAPYHLKLSPDSNTLAVACRGGRLATEREEGADSAGSKVRIDKKTDAASGGSVVLINTTSYARRAIEAGRQPGGMVFTRDSKTLYVASTDDDTLLTLDVTAGSVKRATLLRPAADPGFGQIPTDVALSADEKTLYVACGGANAVAVVEAASGKLQGHFPTGWFPIAIAGSEKNLVVASSKGFGGRVKRDGAAASFGVHGTVGLVQFVAPPRDLRGSSQTVAKNNGWGGNEPTARNAVAPVPVPARVGEPSVFKHVVYIIKENQTYDGVFGDMKEGNGEARLCTFPEEVTPNHHALAREFVLLDNTYTSGTNSADGHQWSVSGIGNAYIEQNYGAHARSYPYDGGDPLAYSPKGFLWTAALASGRSVRVYGEFVNKPSIVNKTTGKKGGTWAQLWADYQTGMKTYEITSDTDNAALKPHLHPNYIGFPSSVPDQWRADQYIADIDRFEREGKMPNLSILLLPNDHTAGTRAGGPTPRATVADNDLALGRIVERLSKSAFWKDTLILVIEDDSQFGVDHVDGHRTVALCISPYTRRGTVVHEQYDHTSFLRTMGLILGFPAMNRFDRTATPLTSCFQNTANLRAYTVRPNRIPLDELNPAPQQLTGEARRLAQASAMLNWEDVDRADSETVTRAIWQAQKPGVPFPLKDYHPSKETDND